jgi:hypothetical protein
VLLADDLGSFTTTTTTTTTIIIIIIHHHPHHHYHHSSSSSSSSSSSCMPPHIHMMIVFTNTCVQQTTKQTVTCVQPAVPNQSSSHSVHVFVYTLVCLCVCVGTINTPSIHRIIPSAIILIHDRCVRHDWNVVMTHDIAIKQQ